MMKTSIKLIAAVSVIALGASAFAAEKNGPADEIRAWYAAVVADFVACNVDAFGKYDAESHSAYYPDSLKLADENNAESRQMGIDFCKNGGKNGLTYEIADIVMLKDAALILGSGHYKRTEPGGAVSIDADYNFTDVAVKTSAGWKLRHTHVGAVQEMTPVETQ